MLHQPDISRVSDTNHTIRLTGGPNQVKIQIPWGDVGRYENKAGVAGQLLTRREF